MFRAITTVIVVALFSGSLACADAVDPLKVHLTKNGGKWNASVTLKHGDTGWDHYADGWRIVDEKGAVLGTRTLFHPHVNEQPFTRSLGGINIPSHVETVYVEAHDKVHGWSKKRIKVDLSKLKGERFRVTK